jgi:hypothetical protein
MNIIKTQIYFCTQEAETEALQVEGSLCHITRPCLKTKNLKTILVSFQKQELKNFWKTK